MIRATNAELDNAANEIFNILRIFDSPQDAGTAFGLAYWQFIQACFPPEDKTKAILAIDEQARLLKEFINEGWH